MLQTDRNTGPFLATLLASVLPDERIELQIGYQLYKPER
jgi:hypothetical protein